MELILLRHCEPFYSNGDSFNYEHLTDYGKKCALKLTNDLMVYKIDEIITSPLPRAVETANIIGSKLGVSVTIEYDLREWETECKKHDDKKLFNLLFLEFIKHRGKRTDDCKYSWEDIDNLGYRFFSVLEKKANFNNKRYLIVGHKMLFGQIIDSRGMNYGDYVLCNYYRQKYNGFVDEYVYDK